ncbi:MAG: hypothetical protein BWZ08_02825 [candidate division BRC1 bacterium ADurb.BinA292]|nr:MAG: hypothetical protein BWZ08_02825 [candidate division BRC1 bacterium ADurb.BinA292]
MLMRLIPSLPRLHLAMQHADESAIVRLAIGNQRHLRPVARICAGPVRIGFMVAMFVMDMLRAGGAALFCPIDRLARPRQVVGIQVRRVGHPAVQVALRLDPHQVGRGRADFPQNQGKRAGVDLLGDRLGHHEGRLPRLRRLERRPQQPDRAETGKQRQRAEHRISAARPRCLVQPLHETHSYKAIRRKVVPASTEKRNVHSAA